MDRFVRGGGWFVTQLVSFWEPPGLRSRVSWRRTPPAAPRQPGGVGVGVGGRGGWEHFRPAPMSRQTHAMGNVFSFPFEYIVWVLKDPGFSRTEAGLPLRPTGHAAFV